MNIKVTKDLIEQAFITSLFIKALLNAEAKAMRRKLTLVIPNYIESYVPEEDKGKLIEVIDNLKCDIEYVWNHNKTLKV